MKSNPVLASFLLAGLAPLGAAVLPYTNDFSGAGSNTALTELNDAHWALNNGAYRYTNSSTVSPPAAGVASVSITDVAGNAFTMETQFTVSSIGTVNSNGQRVGFGLLGASTGFGGSNSGSSFYLADFLYANPSAPGALRILALGNTADMSGVDATVDANPGDATLALLLGTTYTLRLTGSYSGSVLNMTLGLFDAAGATQIGNLATASDSSPLTGTNFGFRNRTGLSGGTAIIDFDNFGVTATAIPEPSSALPMGCLALFGAAGLRRKLHRSS